MFDIGFWEILLIAVLTMIIVGPEKLPGVAKTAGRWFGKTRRFIEGVKTEVEQEFDVTELKRLMHNQEVQINELTQKLSNPDILDEEIESITSSVYSIEEETTAEKETTAGAPQENSSTDKPNGDTIKTNE